MSHGTVLVIARRARSLKGIRRALGLAGCGWTVATDERSALSALDREGPDLILLELGALRSSGLGLLSSLRAACPVPVLLVTDSALSRQDLAELLPEVDGVLPGAQAPALLRDLLAAPEAQPEPRLRILSALSGITRTLGSGPDRRAVQEQVLDLLHRELRLPCALLAQEPHQEHLGLSCERGLQVDAARLLRLNAQDPRLDAEEPTTPVEADPQGPDLAAWCARHGYARAALASLHCRGRFKGVLVMFAEGARTFHPHELGLLSAVAGQAALLLDNLELYQGARTKQLLVEKLLGRVINAQEEERKWMAAEIHDTIAQSLVGMLTMVQTCRQILAADPQSAGDLLDELRGLVTESLGEIRQILFNLRPASLDDLGLVPSLENYARRFQQGTDIQLELHLPGRNQSRLAPLVETTVFRITQEALTNIKKHSGARHARVTLDVGTADLRLTVADDGHGLVWSEVSDRFQSGESHGLQGMQERARLLGGSFRVSNDPSGGTILEVVIPLARPAPSSSLGSPALDDEMNLLLQEVLGGTLRGGELTVEPGRNA